MNFKVCTLQFIWTIFVYFWLLIQLCSCNSRHHYGINDDNYVRNRSLCRTKRIINGTNAIHGRIFSVVSMSHKPSWWWMEREHICGGVMITSQWVLSSAHCFFG